MPGSHIFDTQLFEPVFGDRYGIHGIARKRTDKRREARSQLITLAEFFQQRTGILCFHLAGKRSLVILVMVSPQ